MKLFDKQTQQIVPLQPETEALTVCIYDAAASDEMQLSQVFTYCATDVLVRYLQMQGHQVNLNILLAGNTSEEPWFEAWLTQMQNLRLRPPGNFSIIEGTQPPNMQSDILITNPLNHPDNVEPITAGLFLETAVPEQAEMPGSILLQTYPTDALRIYLAQHHYRKSWTYDEVVLQKATSFVEKLKAAMSARSTGEQPINITPAQRRFTAVMDNDLDTSKGIATLLNLADEILFRASNGYRIEEAQAALQGMAAVFGLNVAEEETAADNITDGWNAFRQQFVKNLA